MKLQIMQQGACSFSSKGVGGGWMASNMVENINLSLP
jgi:hypothetical protein